MQGGAAARRTSLHLACGWHGPISASALERGNMAGLKVEVDVA